MVPVLLSVSPCPSMLPVQSRNGMDTRGVNKLMLASAHCGLLIGSAAALPARICRGMTAKRDPRERQADRSACPRPQQRCPERRQYH
jgi:hypothetical protein